MRVDERNQRPETKCYDVRDVDVCGYSLHCCIYYLFVFAIPLSAVVFRSILLEGSYDFETPF